MGVIRVPTYSQRGTKPSSFTWIKRNVKCFTLVNGQPTYLKKSQRFDFYLEKLFMNITQPAKIAEKVWSKEFALCIQLCMFNMPIQQKLILCYFLPFLVASWLGMILPKKFFCPSHKTFWLVFTAYSISFFYQKIERDFCWKGFISNLSIFF